MKWTDDERVGRIAWWATFISIWVVIIAGMVLNWWVIIDEGAKTWPK